MTGTREPERVTRTAPGWLGPEAAWLHRAETQAALAMLTAREHEARAVGGAVRNALLARPVVDVDIATTALPEQVMALAAEAGLAAVPTGLDHGTVTVIVDHMAFEVTTLRRDVETFGRHARVAFTDDWLADARRRDFTMNALYCDAGGTIFDPLGGYDDLVAGRVRFIGNARARIREDYLRILRFFRLFGEYGGAAPDPDGLLACVRERAGLARLSSERIGAEIRRLLVAPGAGDAIAAMFDYGLLSPVLAAAPRLALFLRLIGVEAALARPPDAMLRLAALAVHVREDAARLAKRLRLSRRERTRLEALSRARPTLETAMSESKARAALYRLGPETFTERVLFAWALAGAEPGHAGWRTLRALPERWQAPVFPIAGCDLLSLGITPGPGLGALLRRLEAEWIADDFSSDHTALLARAAALVEGEDGREHP